MEQKVCLYLSSPPGFMHFCLSLWVRIEKSFYSRWEKIEKLYLSALRSQEF
jgi:hypothetical protein